jgi:hypothetical protein
VGARRGSEEVQGHAVAQCGERPADHALGGQRTQGAFEMREDVRRRLDRGDPAVSGRQPGGVLVEDPLDSVGIDEGIAEAHVRRQVARFVEPDVEAASPAHSVGRQRRCRMSTGWVRGIPPGCDGVPLRWRRPPLLLQPPDGIALRRPPDAHVDPPGDRGQAPLHDHLPAGEPADDHAAGDVVEQQQ